MSLGLLLCITCDEHMADLDRNPEDTPRAQERRCTRALCLGQLDLIDPALHSLDSAVSLSPDPNWPTPSSSLFPPTALPHRHHQGEPSAACTRDAEALLSLSPPHWVESRRKTSLDLVREKRLPLLALLEPGDESSAGLSGRQGGGGGQEHRLAWSQTDPGQVLALWFPASAGLSLPICEVGYTGAYATGLFRGLSEIAIRRLAVRLRQ